MLNFTPRAQQALVLARKEAERYRQHYVGTEHLLLGIILQGQGVAVNVLQRMGVQLESIQAAVERELTADQKSGAQTEKPSEQEMMEGLGGLPFTPRVKKVLSLAAKEARALNHPYIGTEHLLLGLLREEEGVAARILKSLGVQADACRKGILAEIDPNFTNEPQDMPMDPMSAPGLTAPSVDLPRGADKTPALKSFGRDLTELAKKGEIDPVIGRSSEIQRVIQVLCRRTKNNPVLIGEAGVGKTAIVEGLAQEIVNGNVPDILKDRRVITLDLALMVAGTKYRGQFEERLKMVMDEIRRSKNVIIFIDELHTIVGAGSAEGAMDASNILKPALSRGEVQCIGATTIAEYRKHIEKDTALDRRFQSVKVEPTSVEDTILILKGIRKKYEEHHKINYTDRALDLAAKMSDRYIMGRHLPDKAIDILDEAGASARISAMGGKAPTEALEKELADVIVQKNKAIEQQHFEEAAKLRDKEKQLTNNKTELLTSWEKDKSDRKVTVDERDVLRVVATWTGIPLDRIEEKESQKLLKLEEDLQSELVGQNDAVSVVSRALRRSRADLKDPKRPIGSFLFLGPTGVGKTYLAKLLAEKVFGEQNAIIQVDMSEYMEKFALSRLIGSPPGYVGYDEGGQLTEAVRRRPYSVVLFDEIEKAHPDVVQILLQVLEEGRLTDSLGRVVDFRNTIVIMTSNAGAEMLQKDIGLGFGQGMDNESDFVRLKECVLEEAKKVFKPEFINRVSEIVVFRQLDKQAMHAIVDVELMKFGKRLKAQDMTFCADENAKQFLIDKGYDKKFGARPLKRAIEKYVEDPLAEAILRGDIDKTRPINAVLDGEAIIFKQHLDEAKMPPVETKKSKKRKATSTNT